MNVTNAVTDLLIKRSKDFLTVNQIRDSLPTEIIRFLGLKKRSSPVAEVIKKLRPFFNGKLREYKGARTRYIGLDMSYEDLVVNTLTNNLQISSKKLRNRLPMVNREFILTLNSLLTSGKITCVLDEKSHTPRLFAICQSNNSENQGDKPENHDIVLFKKAYNLVGKGLSFVRIHRIRDQLNWSDERFDRILKNLRKEHMIQLQGGDPSMLTESELKRSFVDEKGRQRITVTWVKND